MTTQCERREVWFRGRVQGVGFRYATRDVATRFAVTGFVENLTDGRVRIVVEGRAAEIDRFLSAVASEMQRHIDGREDQFGSASGEFEGFTIRR